MSHAETLYSPGNTGAGGFNRAGSEYYRETGGRGRNQPSTDGIPSPEADSHVPIPAGMPELAFQPVSSENRINEEDAHMLTLLENLMPPDLSGLEIGDMIPLYFKEIGAVPLLTREDEILLSQRIERGNAAQHELAGGNIPLRRQAELKEFIKVGWAAKEHLVVANGRLVIGIAKKYRGRGVPFLDLIQEGNIGLIRAAKKFDYHRGRKFSTHASWWIRQSVERAAQDQGRTIRLPIHIGERLGKLFHAQNELKHRLGRDATSAELAENLEKSVRYVEDLIEISRWPLSLETPVDNREDDVLGDFIPDDGSVLPEENADWLQLREKSEKILSTLPPKQERVMRFRLGFTDGNSHTLEETGRMMGISKQGAALLEKRALGFLRQSENKRELDDFRHMAT